MTVVDLTTGWTMSAAAPIRALGRTVGAVLLAAVLGAVAALMPAINGFFDAVLVMAEDPAVRANRLALVARVAGLPDAVADLSRMEGF